MQSQRQFRFFFREFFSLILLIFCDFEFDFLTTLVVQAACIPLALTGRDICGSAITGSGKVRIYLEFLCSKLPRELELLEQYGSFGFWGISLLQKFCDLDQYGVIWKISVKTLVLLLLLILLFPDRLRPFHYLLWRGYYIGQNVIGQ